MWVYFLIGWILFLLAVYLHLIFDILYYYSKMPKFFRRVYKAFTEE